MIDHRTRIILIASLIALVVVAMVVLAVFADPDVADSVIARLEGAGLVLVPALADAAAEGKKRAREEAAE